MLARNIAKASSVKEVYGIVTQAANAEGLGLPPLEEMKKIIEEESKPDEFAPHS